MNPFLKEVTVVNMNDFERQKLLGILKLALQDAKTVEDFHVRLTLSQADLLFLISLIEKKAEKQ